MVPQLFVLLSKELIILALRAHSLSRWALHSIKAEPTKMPGILRKPVHDELVSVS